MENKQDVNLRVNYRVTKIPQFFIDHCISFYGKDWKEKVCKEFRKSSKEQIESVGCKVYEGHNIVPNYLRFELASLIAGNTITPTFKANYVALGTDATVASNGDLKLYAETIRRTFTNRESTDNVALLDKYFESFEVGGNTYREIGVFVDGTATANTGYLLSRIVINETIASNEALIVNISFTIS